MDHSGTEDLDPAFSFAKAATLAAADEAGNVNFGGRFGEREVMRTETNLGVFAEHGFGESGKRTF